MVPVRSGVEGSVPVGHPGRDPIAPHHEEGRRLAERGPDIVVRPCRLRKRFGEDREHAGQAERSSNRHDPGDDRIDAVGRKVRGQEEDARPDHVAHDECERDGEAELARRRSGLRNGLVH